MAVDTKPTIPSVEEAERVIAHLLSYPDECEETLDAVRYIMQWLSFTRPTEAALLTHARYLRKPVPEGIREGVDHVPSTRHRTSIIVKGVLEGYLKWLRKINPQKEDSYKNHPETGDDVDPDAPKEPHPSHHLIVHDNLGGTEQQEVCGYCGKTDEIELRKPCPEVERMNREEDAYRENPCAELFLRSPMGKNDG